MWPSFWAWIMVPLRAPRAPVLLRCVTDLSVAARLSYREPVDLSLEEPAEPPPVLLLEVRLHPVLAGDRLAAAGAAAAARHLVVAVVGGGPVVGQLLAGRDVAHGHADDLSLDRDVGIARVVEVEHGAVPLVAVRGGDEQIV